jgi:hypothetical protein
MSAGSIVACVDQRDEQVLIETSRYRITGMLRLPRDGYRSRLTEYLNASDRAFLPLTDVEIAPLDEGRAPERRAFLALSLAHVLMAMPADASRGEDGISANPA